MSIINLQK